MLKRRVISCLTQVYGFAQRELVLAVIGLSVQIVLTDRIAFWISFENGLSGQGGL